MSPFCSHEILHHDHLLDGPIIFIHTHYEYASQHTRSDFMNSVVYIKKGIIFISKKQLERIVKLLHLKIGVLIY